MNDNSEAAPVAAKIELVPLDALLAVLLSISTVLMTLSFDEILENHFLWEFICFFLPAVIILSVRSSLFSVFTPFLSTRRVFFAAAFLLLSATVFGVGLGGIIDNLFDVSELSEEIQKEISLYPFYQQIFLFAVLPAVCEELLFRGVMLNALKKAGARTAVIVTSLVFAVFHGSVELFLPILVVSLALSIIGMQKGGLPLAILFHFLHNFINLILMNYVEGDLGLWLALAITATGLALYILSIRLFLGKETVVQKTI
jgi:membrane protease YdiL (CAAX protease family)